MKFKNYIETESGIKDTSTSPGTAGQLLSSTVAGTSWIDQNTISSGTSETIDIQVKNISSPNGGINLVKGDPVYIYGNVGASPRLYVDLADADSTATNNLGNSKMPCVALLDQDLAPNIEGTATVVGKLRNLITSPIGGDVPNENDTVYVKSGGGLTLIKPTGSTNLIQNVGQVGRVSTSNDGNIVVAALLRTNDVPNLPTGRIWVGDGNTIVSDTVYVDEPNNRVGIGTNNPNSTLEVAGEIDSVGGDGYLLEGIPWARSNSGLLELGDWDGVGYDTSIFGANGNIPAIRTLGGNVGIGTTNPGTYKLAVAGSTAIGGNVEVSDGLGGDKVLTLTANTGSFQIGDIDGLGNEAHIEGDSSNIKIFTSGTERVRVNSSGNVGMGTTSLTNISSTVTTLSLGGTNTSFSGGIAFQVNGVVKAYNYVVSNYLINQTVAGVGQVFYGAGSERMRIHNTTGNIGVNTVSPFAKLHVASGSTSDAPTAGTATGGLWVSNFSKTFGTNIGVSGSGWSFIQGQRADGNTTLYNLNLQPLGGNVGIGTTSPQAKLHVLGTVGSLPALGAAPSAAQIGGSAFGTLFSTLTSGKGVIQQGRNDGEATSYDLLLQPSGGNVGIGTTNPTQKLHVVGRVASTAGQGFQIINSYGSPWLSDFYGSFTTSSPLYVGGPYSGQACYASAFNITSDYRLKENEVPLTEASSRIKKLKPIRFNYISSENTVDGFLAHEVGEVIPEAVTGEKDAVREDGSNELQGLDLSKIVPLLTAALQETITKIEQLEQRIKTLENK